MTYIVQNNEKILVWFDVQDGKPFAEIDDANYVRAETVLYDETTHCMHAVLYDGLFLIGEVPEPFRGDFSAAKKVRLKSLLPDGAAVCMKADVRVIRGLEHISQTKKEEGFDLLPVFAAAGHAMCGVISK